jgi:hypothetical protein
MSMAPGIRTQDVGGEFGETPDLPGGTQFETDKPRPAGGFDPNEYKTPTNWGTRDAPYVYSTEDIGILYKVPARDIIRYNSLLIKAFPGYKPGTTMENRFDSKFKSQAYAAMSVINQMNADPNSPLRGKSFEASLAHLAENPLPSKVGSGPSVTVSNPDDLRRVFTQASQSVLGRTLNPQEINRMVSTYQGIQAGSQRQQGAVRTSAPSAETFGIEQATQAAPVEAKAMEYVDYIGSLAKLMAG